MTFWILVWDEANIHHIARHAVVQYEVEEVFERFHQMLRVDSNRYVMRGQTYAGRFLTVYLDALGEGRAYVVTARDMTGREKGHFRKWL